MYRQVLARVLAEDFVEDRRWTETRALELGRLVLRGNIERIFPAR
jgi:glucuronate isomerase